MGSCGTRASVQSYDVAITVCQDAAYGVAYNLGEGDFCSLFPPWIARACEEDGLVPLSAWGGDAGREKKNQLCASKVIYSHFFFASLFLERKGVFVLLIFSRLASSDHAGRDKKKLCY